MPTEGEMTAMTRVLQLMRSLPARSARPLRDGLVIVAGIVAYHHAPEIYAAARTAFAGTPPTWEGEIAKSDVTDAQILMLREDDEAAVPPVSPMVDVRTHRAFLVDRVADKALRLQALKVAHGIDTPSLGGIGAPEAGIVPHDMLGDEVVRSLGKAMDLDPDHLEILKAVRNAYVAKKALFASVKAGLDADVPAPGAPAPR